MTMEVSFRGTEVRVNGRSLLLPHEVVQQMQVGSLLLLRVEPPPGQVFNRNVFAVDADARLLWQIAESPHGTEADKPFMSLALDAEGEVLAGNWNGVNYRVDLKTGSLRVVGFSK